MIQKHCQADARTCGCQAIQEENARLQDTLEQLRALMRRHNNSAVSPPVHWLAHKALLVMGDEMVQARREAV